jgi:polysaccharide biosynthesis protein PslE
VHDTFRSLAAAPPRSLAGEVGSALRRHKGKAALLFVLVMAATAAITWLMPKKYHSEARLFMRLGRENTTVDPTVLGAEGMVSVPQSRESEINSVAEILHTRNLIEKVVDGVGPAAILGQATATESDRDRAVRRLGRDLITNPVRRTNIIAVSYEGYSPEVAQQVLLKLIEAYLPEHLRLNRAVGAHDFLAEETMRIRNELTKAEEKLRDLKSSTGLISPDSQREETVTLIGRIDDDLRRNGALLAASQAKVNQMERESGRLPESEITSSVAGLSNEGTDNMRGQLYALRLREQQLAAKLTDDHPLLQEVRRQVGEAQRLVAQEDPTRTHVTSSPNRVRHEVEKTLVVERPGLAGLEAESASLATQMNAARQRLRQVNEQSLQLTNLQRDIQLLEASYRRYATSLEQTRIDQSLESQRISNISIAQPPSYEPQSVAPKAAWNLALGLAVGLCGALGLALAADSWVAPAEAPVEPPELPEPLPRAAPAHERRRRELVPSGKH